MSRLGLIPPIVVVVATRLALAAQQQPGPAFEVVSIKPSQSTADGTIIRPQPDGRFVADNITVLNLIQQAYDVFAFQIVGAPSWLDRERFDIQAIPPSTASAQQDVLLQRLLEERFALRLRREKRDGDIYALVIAQADGRLGPNLRPFTGDCTPAGGQSPCRMRNGPNFTDAVGIPFSRLVGQVIGNVNRIVVDKTGLTGRFDFSYKWANDLPATDAADGRVSFMTALEEQLGLRLERTTAPVDVLVIESVERPAPN
jgi:uncharacterized protein (TIGR03435 family)